MANTSQKHKEKKSQKRKDRQLRRQQKQDAKAAAAKQNGFIVSSMKQMKGASKSLPGFLAKNADLICKWLKEYCKLFQKADDACIDYMKTMERSKRDELVQDYVDIHTFISLVHMLKSKASTQDNMQDDKQQEKIEKEEPQKEDMQDEEAVQQDMG